MFAEELPWLPWLPIAERGSAVSELLDNLLAGVDTGNYLPFLRKLLGWKRTAEIYTDPELVADLSGPMSRDEFTIKGPRPKDVK